MERETVPDTEDYILLDKIGMVWEYTREYTSIHSKFRNKYQVYRVYGYLGHLLSCRQDPCSIIHNVQKERGAGVEAFFSDVFPKHKSQG